MPIENQGQAAAEHGEGTPESSTTLDYISKKIEALRSEIRSDINELRSELRSDINELRAEQKKMRVDISEIRREQSKLKRNHRSVQAALDDSIPFGGPGNLIFFHGYTADTMSPIPTSYRQSTFRSFLEED